MNDLRPPQRHPQTSTPSQTAPCSSGCLPVILAGGDGTRLWPASRRDHPKPFLPLPDGSTLFGAALRRAASLPGARRVVVVTRRAFFFLARDIARSVFETFPADTAPAIDWLLEPEPRNTAPALALTALYALSETAPDGSPRSPVLMVLPADHRIDDPDAFHDAVGRALAAADARTLVVFGLPPERAETDFGYIELADDAAPACAGDTAAPAPATLAVRRFVEKPDAERAAAFVADGRHLWNAGLFAFQAQALWSAIEDADPALAEAARACWMATDPHAKPIEFDAARFSRLPARSIDHAVLEPLSALERRLRVVPSGFRWADIGAWTSYATLLEPDERGNRVQGDAELVDCRDSLIVAHGRLVAAAGLRDTTVVETHDAVLVAQGADAGRQVRELVARLDRRRHSSVAGHATVHRPWGHYTVLEEGPRFKIKRIVVRAGERLSLQRHFHRSEHWVVVSGTAEVTRGDETLLLRPDESTFIPAGVAHRLANPGRIDCVMIEVQCGDYVGEDDIERIDDLYRRETARPC